LRHEILSIFFAIFSHIKQPHPKRANALRQLLGNEFNRGTAIYFHVSHAALDQVTGHMCRSVTTGAEGGGEVHLKFLSP